MTLPARRTPARALALALILLAAMGLPVRAWNADGHMIVAYIAYRHLTPAARRRVGVLLELNPQYHAWIAGLPAGSTPDQRARRAFTQAANWPDYIKTAPGYVSDGPDGGYTPPASPIASQNIGYPDRNRHLYWHFLDMPFSDDGTSLRPAASTNAVTQIVLLGDALGSRATPDGIKSYDLVWLIHLVGDQHQPLHSVSRFTHNDPDGDSGGNDVKLHCSPDVACADNLHAQWDGILGNTHDLAVVSATGTSLDARPVPAGADIADPQIWSDESAALARRDVYIDPAGAPLGDPKASIGPAYLTRAKKVAEVRVILAGRRLASLLNAALDR